MWYVVCYTLYECANSITLETASQYMNFIDVMQENFGEWFKVEKILWE